MTIKFFIYIEDNGQNMERINIYEKKVQKNDQDIQCIDFVIVTFIQARIL